MDSDSPQAGNNIAAERVVGEQGNVRDLTIDLDETQMYDSHIQELEALYGALTVRSC
jgi:hypothetical protein